MLFVSGCGEKVISESKALDAITKRADAVVLRETDHPETIDTVGALLYTIDEVTR